MIDVNLKAFRSQLDLGLFTFYQSLLAAGLSETVYPAALVYYAVASQPVPGSALSHKKISTPHAARRTFLQKYSGDRLCNSTRHCMAILPTKGFELQVIIFAEPLRSRLSLKLCLLVLMVRKELIRDYYGKRVKAVNKHVRAALPRAVVRLAPGPARNPLPVSARAFSLLFYLLIWGLFRHGRKPTLIWYRSDRAAPGGPAIIFPGLLMRHAPTQPPGGCHADTRT